MRIRTFLFTFFLLAICRPMNAQSTAPVLPYQAIPDYPEQMTATAVAARMIDGLGYRYYWATEGLREQDLDYRPSPEARTTRETLDHIYGLTRMILNASEKAPNVRPSNEPKRSFAGLRSQTLANLKTASDLLKADAAGDLSEYRIINQRGDNTTEFSYWHVLNGPLADALYHVGQVVSFRRSAGNPIDPRVNVFMGRNRE